MKKIQIETRCRACGRHISYSVATDRGQEPIRKVTCLKCRKPDPIHFFPAEHLK